MDTKSSKYQLQYQRRTLHNREYRVYEHLANVVEKGSLHPGQSLIREVYVSSKLQNTPPPLPGVEEEEEGKGEESIHQCLLLQPMTMSLHDMLQLNSRPFDLPLLKMTIKRILLALDFLHVEAGVVHTGIITFLFYPHISIYIYIN